GGGTGPAARSDRTERHWPVRPPARPRSPPPPPRAPPAGRAPARAPLPGRTTSPASCRIPPLLRVVLLLLLEQLLAFRLVQEAEGGRGAGGVQHHAITIYARLRQLDVRHVDDAV